MLRSLGNVYGGKSPSVPDLECPGIPLNKILWPALASKALSVGEAVIGTLCHTPFTTPSIQCIPFDKWLVLRQARTPWAKGHRLDPASTGIFR